jgi:hypothetical protein
MGINKIV